jgi:dolichol-phosphate mannosyltransferase
VLEILNLKGPKFDERYTLKVGKHKDRDRNTPSIWVVIPAYRCSKQIVEVVNSIGPEVDRVIVVDDSCPQGSGKVVEKTVKDTRVTIVYNTENLGVGGSVIRGYRIAMAGGADVVVKVDGDGQMDARRIPELVSPITTRSANYTKGNRFHSLKFLRGMPKIRLIGNSLLTFICKLSSGYWEINDPNNGFTAIDSASLSRIDLDMVSKRYFFESDMLFHLNSIKACTRDIPMPSIYSSEESSLKIRKVLFTFISKHFRNAIRRIFESYFLREINIGTINLISAIVLLSFGFIFGGTAWVQAITSGTLTPVGTVSLASLSIILGAQFLIAFLQFDVQRSTNFQVIEI